MWIERSGGSASTARRPVPRADENRRQSVATATTSAWRVTAQYVPRHEIGSSRRSVA